MNDYQLLRQKFFDEAISPTAFQSQQPLTAGFAIHKDLYIKLQAQVQKYLRVSTGGKLDEESSMARFLERFSDHAKNVSTSGIVIPKSYCSEEFTDIHRTLAEILDQTQLRQAVEFWIYPFNVRIKGAIKSSESLSYPTELPHSETWVGCSLRSVLLHIPILGDMEFNKLKVWKPNGDFGPEWLKPLNSYRDGEKLISESSELSVSAMAGKILMVDSSLLHGTSRTENAGPRVSIDLNVVLKTYSPEMFRDEKHLLVSRQKISNSDFFAIGKTLKISSPDGENDIYSPAEGMRHPANIKILKI